ncbi:MAG: hypothetical protein HYY45_12035 [Deltaproteobacteria bacterium]|nr:hypothetical protein [Deltaproteobacteria bacterium]
MTLAQKYTLWAAGILLWIFGLSILLSTIAYGYMDLPTIGHMALVLFPPLLLAAILLVFFKRPRDLKAREERAAHVGQAVTEGRT